MKKMILTAISLILLSVSILFVGCSSKSNYSASNGSSSSVSGSTEKSTGSTISSSSDSKVFTVDELKKYNGQNGNPAYVAVNGTVYDVTHAKGWKNGKHRSGIVAGMDLTKALADSPHGDSVLKDLPIVGTLK